MSIHFILLLVIMAVSVIYASGNENLKNKKTCVSFITVILALFSGLRTWWFGDLIKYYTLYRGCNGADWASEVFKDWTNIGIRLFFKSLGMVGISYDICIFVIAAFFAICLGVIVYKFSPSPYWSYVMLIAMGFFIFTYSGLKQTIAMGFILIASNFIFESKPKLFALFTFIAFLFHAPAAIFFAAYPIAKKKIDRKYFLIVILAFVLVFIFRNQIVDFVSQAYYDDESKFSENGGIGGRTIMMIFIMGFGLFMRPLHQEDRMYAQVFNLMVISTIIQIFSMYNNVFTRLADYYYQFIVLFMPLIMESGDHQARIQPERASLIRYNAQYVYVLASIAITGFSLWYYNSYINGAEMLQNYKFFWEIDAHALYGA